MGWVTSKRLKIQLSKWDTRSYENVFKLKCEKIKNWDQDNPKLLKEANEIRFRSPRSRIQRFESESDELLRGWRLNSQSGTQEIAKNFQIEIREIQGFGPR